MKKLFLERSTPAFNWRVGVGVYKIWPCMHCLHLCAKSGNRCVPFKLHRGCGHLMDLEYGKHLDLDLGLGWQQSSHYHNPSHANDSLNSPRKENVSARSSYRYLLSAQVEIHRIESGPCAVACWSLSSALASLWSHSVLALVTSRSSGSGVLKSGFPKPGFPLFAFFIFPVFPEHALVSSTKKGLPNHIAVWQERNKLQLSTFIGRIWYWKKNGKYGSLGGTKKRNRRNERTEKTKKRNFAFPKSQKLPAFWTFATVPGGVPRYVRELPELDPGDVPGVPEVELSRMLRRSVPIHHVGVVTDAIGPLAVCRPSFSKTKFQIAKKRMSGFVSIGFGRSQVVEVRHFVLMWQEVFGTTQYCHGLMLNTLSVSLRTWRHLASRWVSSSTLQATLTRHYLCWKGSNLIQWKSSRSWWLASWDIPTGDFFAGMRAG